LQHEGRVPEKGPTLTAVATQSSEWLAPSVVNRIREGAWHTRLYNASGCMRRNLLRQRFAYQGRLRSIASLIFRFACGKTATACCVRSLQRLQLTEHGRDQFC